MARSPRSSSPPSAGWRWAVLGGIAGLLFSLVVNAPAHWLASLLRSISNEHVLLVNARGTVWNGSASMVLASGVGGAESISLPGTMQWRLSPRWNGVDVALEFPCCAAQPLGLNVTPSTQGVRLVWRDGQSRWPAALLTGLGAPWNTLRLDGMLNLHTQSLVMQWQGARMALTGRMALDGTDISSSLSTLKPMGSYRLTLEGGPSPSLLLVTLDGSSLLLSGSGQLSGNRMRFSGEASAAPGREDALSNLLNIIGRRTGARSHFTLG